MVVRSLLVLCAAVGENVTYLDKANGINFSAEVEEKNEMAFQGPGELFTRDDKDMLLADLNALSRSANRRSTRRELERSLAQNRSGRGQVGRVHSLDQGQPLAAESGAYHRADQGSC